MKRSGRLLLLVILIALVMRAPVNCVGPIAEELRSSLGISYALYGWLAGLPVLLFGLLCPLAGVSIRRFSAKNVFTAGILLLAAGSFVRADPSAVLLFAGTFVMSAGIVHINVLMPSVIRSGFGENWISVMSLYSALISASSALGTALAVPLFRAFETTAAPLLVWGVLALPALLLMPAFHAAAAAKTESQEAVRHFPLREELSLMTVWGSQAVLSTAAALWFPTVLMERGASPDFAGLTAALFVGAGIFGSLLQPGWSRLLPDFRKRIPAAAVPYALILLSFLFTGKEPLFNLSAALAAGLFQGIVIAESFAMPARKTADFQRLASLSGRVQSGGYLLAGAGPSLIGIAVGAAGSWIVPVLAAAVALLWMSSSLLSESQSPT